MKDILLGLQSATEFNCSRDECRFSNRCRPTSLSIWYDGTTVYLAGVLNKIPNGTKRVCAAHIQLSTLVVHWTLVATTTRRTKHLISNIILFAKSFPNSSRQPTDAAQHRPTTQGHKRMSKSKRMREPSVFSADCAMTRSSDLTKSVCQNVTRMSFPLSFAANKQ